MRALWLPSRVDVPGIGLATGLGAIAVACARALPPSPYVSDVLVALLLGVLIRNTPLASALGLGLVGKEREPDRYAAGLRFVGKWMLRLAIILMGMKVQTSFFGKTELALIFGVAAASLPSAFFVSHVLGVAFGVRRPLTDILAGGTMICGASAVNAIAPVAGARREEQGVAIGVVFLFSVAAMLTFRALATALELPPAAAGLWSGLAVNDLSSAIAVGAQMGGAGGVMAAASKSARILLLAPVLVVMSLARREGRIVPVRGLPGGVVAGSGGAVSAERTGLTRTIVDALPGFLLGYVALALVRAAGDRMFGQAAAWQGAIVTNRFVLDLLMSAVSAGIGLHLSLRAILGSSARAVAVGGGASVWMAGVTLGMVTAASRGNVAVCVGIGIVAVAGSAVAFRLFAHRSARERSLRKRFDAGDVFTLADATTLLDARERDGVLDDAFLRRLLDLLSPSIGELIPARTSPLPHGAGCRWVTYWEGRTGWALVAVVREPGSVTPIHAHPHRMIGKAIEGRLEELRFKEASAGEIELVSRDVLAHDALVEVDGLATIHVVRALGATPAIDLQLRGPECGQPGRLLRPRHIFDVDAIRVGALVAYDDEPDRRPGHGGEGAAAGRVPGEAA